MTIFRNKIHLYFIPFIFIQCHLVSAQVRIISENKDELRIVGYAILIDIINNKYGNKPKLAIRSSVQKQSKIEQVKVDNNGYENILFLSETEPEMPPVKIYESEEENENNEFDYSQIYQHLATNYVINNANLKINEFDKRRMISVLDSILRLAYKDILAKKLHSFDVTLSQYDFLNQSFKLGIPSNNYLKDSDEQFSENFNPVIHTQVIKLSDPLKSLFQSEEIVLGYSPSQNWQQLRMTPSAAEKLVSRYETIEYRRGSTQRGITSLERHAKLKMNYKINNIYRYSNGIYIVTIDPISIVMIYP